MESAGTRLEMENYSETDNFGLGMPGNGQKIVCTKMMLENPITTTIGRQQNYMPQIYNT